MATLPPNSRRIVVPDFDLGGLGVHPRVGASVPWYLFTASWPDGTSEDARTTSLSNDDDARRYAHLIIRELKARPDYRNKGQRMVVQDDDGNIVHIIFVLVGYSGGRARHSTDRPRYRARRSASPQSGGYHRGRHACRICVGGALDPRAGTWRLQQQKAPACCNAGQGQVKDRIRKPRLLE
jgi:hypothetical protein